MSKQVSVSKMRFTPEIMNIFIWKKKEKIFEKTANRRVDSRRESKSEASRARLQQIEREKSHLRRQVERSRFCLYCRGRQLRELEFEVRRAGAAAAGAPGCRQSLGAQRAGLRSPRRRWPRDRLPTSRPRALAPGAGPPDLTSLGGLAPGLTFAGRSVELLADLLDAAVAVDLVDTLAAPELHELAELLEGEPVLGRAAVDGRHDCVLGWPLLAATGLRRNWLVARAGARERPTLHYLRLTDGPQ